MQILVLLTNGQTLFKRKNVALKSHDDFVRPLLAHEGEELDLQAIAHRVAGQSASIHDPLEVVQLEVRKGSELRGAYSRAMISLWPRLGSFMTMFLTCSLLHDTWSGDYTSRSMFLVISSVSSSLSTEGSLMHFRIQSKR